MIRWITFFLLFSSAAFCQPTLEGTIVDSETGKPIPFASIGIMGTSQGTSSNLNGQFSISITGSVLLQITSIGYETLMIYSLEVVEVIKLKPATTQLDAVVVFDKPISTQKIVRKAMAKIVDNYSAQPFMQKFFYRHYCKDDETYGRLIEASVDVWKNKGYRVSQRSAGDKEEIRVTQLRRSLDKTEMAQGHEPISIGNILETDLVGYQAEDVNEHMSFYSNVSNLKMDMNTYSFKFNGITFYDGLEVYEITYVYKKDSVLTPSGDYRIRSQANGSLFITTDTYAFIKREEVKTYNKNTIRTSTFYRKYSGEYYPYHFVLEGESQSSDDSKHQFHIELMSVEIKKSISEKFTGKLPGRDALLNIPYDSAYWASSTILKTTPLEDDIIRDLGGGASLNKQFYHYHNYELNVRDGGKEGEKKFNWFKEDSKGTRILYLVFLSGDLRSYIAELELAKRLHQKYRNKITFVFLSLEDDETIWKETVTKFNLSSDGIINYRIGSHSQLERLYRTKGIPAFVIVARNGEVYDFDAKKPSDPLLEQDFDAVLGQ